MKDNEPNLIQKAVGRIVNKLYDSKIFKRVGALTIAVVLSTSLTACDFNNTPPSPTPDTGTSYVCDDCGGNHKTEDHNKQTEVGYSVLLHSVEENPYYQSIVKQANENQKPNTAFTDEYAYLLNQHPYGFLEDKGYDIEAIKKGEVSCQTYSFVRADQPNRLYICTRVLTKKHTDTLNGYFYDNYMISYDLSEQEVADYKGTYSQQYIYANFLNDAISRQKKATVHLSTITEQYATKELFDYAEKTGTLNRFKPFAGLGETLYVSGIAGATNENEISIIGFTPTKAYYVTLIDREYIDIRENILYDFGSSAALGIKGEEKIYDIEYFNKTWIDCADSEYWAGRRCGGYCCGQMTYDPAKNVSK